MMDPFLGIPVRYAPQWSGLARARGIWPWQSIVVGRAFWRLTRRDQNAVLFHEAHHCRARHLEKRLLLLPLFWTRFAARRAREHEYAADAFCARQGYGVDLARVIWRFHTGPGDEFYPSSSERCARLNQLSTEMNDAQAA